VSEHTRLPSFQVADMPNLEVLADFQQEILDTLPFQIVVQEVISSSEIRIIAANRLIFQVSGFTPDDLLGKRITDVFPAAEATRIIQQALRCIETNAVVEVEELLSLPNGPLWHLSSYIPLGGSQAGRQRILVAIQDITARKQHEQEIREHQEAIIAQQEATLAELSTPLLSISDSTVVMPLVGSVDSRRVKHIMEALLSGVAASRATNVILDITGVPVVDTQVANAFLSVSQAVRLLGSQVILTGIRPEVAQTLVGLGVDLQAIITRGTLRDGIAYALRTIDTGQ